MNAARALPRHAAILSIEELTPTLRRPCDIACRTLTSSSHALSGDLVFQPAENRVRAFAQDLIVRNAELITFNDEARQSAGMQADARIKAFNVIITQVDDLEPGNGLGGDVDDGVVAGNESDESGEGIVETRERACETILADVDAL